MKIIIHNPQSQIIFGRTLLNYLLRVKGYTKYKFLLDYIVKHNLEYSIYIDHAGSSLPRYLSFFIPKKLEVLLWAKINGFNPFRIRVITNINKIKEDDIFFSFSVRNLDNKYKCLDNIVDKEFIKLFHLSHFFQNTSLIAYNFNRFKGDFLVAENNLQKNSYFFRKFFPYYKKDVYLLPFTYQPRFKRYKSFLERKNKCIATGTFVKINGVGNPGVFRDFYSFFKTNTLQPIRRMLYENKDKYKDEIDNYISGLYETKLKKIEGNNIIKRIYNKYYNIFFAGQKNYFKFNIVEKYNEYCMFINGEEINNLPGIGFVEGMACGCAYIGQVDPVYTDLGMKPDVHYISHNGTLEDIIEKIKYYQKHVEKLQQIAEQGYKFVTENFNGEVVAEKFYNDIKKLSGEYKESGYNKKSIKLKSSFEKII